MKTKLVPHIGMRTFKTALAVALSLFIANALCNDTPIFAAVGAITVMQRTVRDSLYSSIGHFFGTLLGFLTGSVYVLIVPTPSSIVPLSIAILFVTAVCVRLHIPTAVTLACVVLIDLGLYTGDSAFLYGFSRFWVTTLGIAIALLVNILIKPYNNSVQLQKMLLHFLQSVPDYLSERVIFEHYPDLTPLKKQLGIIHKELDIYDAQYFPRHKGHREQSIYLRGCYQLADRIVQELSALCTMDETGRLNTRNATLLEEMGLPISNLAPQAREGSEFDIVLNFHVYQLVSAYRFLKSYIEA